MSWKTESADSEGGETSTGPALAMPATGIDPDWRERIELAKRAYEDGKRLRAGKPIMFRMSWPLRLGDGPMGEAPRLTALRGSANGCYGDTGAFIRGLRDEWS